MPLITLRAGLAMWRGEHVEARQAVRRGLDLYEGRTQDVVLQAILLWHGLRVEAEARASGRRADRVTVEHLGAVAERLRRGSMTAAAAVRDAVQAYLALCDAELSRITQSSDVQTWERAVSIWDARRHPYPAAYARLRLAEALYDDRFPNADAADALRLAHGAAQRLGARPLAKEIRDLAERARLRLDEPVGPTPATHTETQAPTDLPADDPLATLTVREYEVLKLVAAGRRNWEIGKKLFISPRTVGVHVSHILEKLQARSRLQASAIYQRAVGGDAPESDDGGTVRS